MTIFPVSDAKVQELRSRMSLLGVFENDIEERFISSGGHGGQNVNKLATCVYLKHRPTGIEVKCSKERTQALNRFFARRILLEKIDEIKSGKMSAKNLEIEKMRKQKRKRRKRAVNKAMQEDTHEQNDTGPA